MTSIDTKSIRARAERATREEWAWAPPKKDGPFPDEVRLSFGNFEKERTGYSLWCGIRAEDAEFIAAARTDVPALCDEVEALRAALAQMTRERDAIDRDRNTLHEQMKDLVRERDEAREKLTAARMERPVAVHRVRLRIFEATREAAARIATPERFSMHPAANFVSSRIQLAINALQLADIDQAPGTKPCDLCGETDGHTKRCSHTKWPAPGTTATFPALPTDPDADKLVDGMLAKARNRTTTGDEPK